MNLQNMSFLSQKVVLAYARADFERLGISADGLTDEELFEYADRRVEYYSSFCGECGRSYDEEE